MVVCLVKPFAVYFVHKPKAASPFEALSGDSSTASHNYRGDYYRSQGKATGKTTPQCTVVQHLFPNELLSRRVKQLVKTHQTVLHHIALFLSFFTSFVRTNHQYWGKNWWLNTTEGKKKYVNEWKTAEPEHPLPANRWKVRANNRFSFAKKAFLNLSGWYT